MLVLDENGNLTEVDPDQHQADLAVEMREYLASRADKNGNVSSDALSDWLILDRDRNVKLEDALFNRLDVIKKKVVNEQQREEELGIVRGRIEQVQEAIKDRAGFLADLLIVGNTILFSLIPDNCKGSFDYKTPENSPVSKTVDCPEIPGPPVDTQTVEDYHNLVASIIQSDKVEKEVISR